MKRYQFILIWSALCAGLGVYEYGAIHGLVWGTIVGLLGAIVLLMLVHCLFQNQQEKQTPELDPRWIVIPVWGEPNPEKHGHHQAPLIGFRVAWSKRDEQGRMLLVRHYLTDLRPGDPSLQWCKRAAERDAKQFNKEKRGPWEFH